MTLLEAYTDFHRGSEWRKWDLHVHTPASIINHYGGDHSHVWDQFINELESLPNEFKVLGINDYWFLDGYERLLKEKNENERLSNIDLLLPVIEFRIDKLSGIEFRKNNNIDMHVIFSNELSPEEIRSQFLNRLSACFILSSNDDDNWDAAITHESLRDLGKKIRNSTPKEKQANLVSSDVRLGFNHLALSFDKLKNVLESSTYLKNKYITCIGKAEWDQLRWSGGGASIKNTLINYADLIFTSSPSIEQYKKAKKALEDQNIKRLLLDCSDSHYFLDSKNKDRIGNCYTWIKADPTFEGLKQVIHEPENRVKIQELSPDNKANHNIIDRIEIDNESIANKEIYFNPDLNVIIGGRSSGKSALLAGLAHHLGCSNEISNDDYKSYIQNDFSKGFSLYFKGSDKAYQKDENAQERIEYFPQNRFSELAKDQDAFDALVKSIVKDEPIYDHVEKYNEEISNLSTQIREALEKCWRLNSEIVDIQDSLNKKPSTEDLEKQEKEFNTKYSKLNAEPISDEERKLYEAKTTTKDDLIKHLKQIESYSRLSESLQQEPIIDISALKEKINRTDFHKLEIKEFLDKELSELESNFKEGWKKALNIFEEKREKELLNTEKDINKIDKDKEYQCIKERLSTNSEAEKIIKEIGNIKKKVSEIKEEEESLKNKQNSLKSEQRKVIQSFYKFSSKTKDLVEKISLTPGSPTGQDSLKITTKMAYNYNQYIQDLVIDKCDQRKLNSRINCEIENELSNDKIHKKIKDIIKVLLRKPDVLRSSVGLQDFLYSILTRSWFSFNYNVEYEGDSFHEMSEGKKSFVILKLILEFSDKKVPLLIDQPEDDLDNRAIFTELVAYLKTKKLDRQIILVTHNANIVVNADSELVIVANQHGNNSPNTDEKQFEYVQGSIEHSFPEKDEESRVLHSQGIREHICEIMEGGIEAFKRREKRYNI